MNIELVIQMNPHCRTTLNRVAIFLHVYKYSEKGRGSRKEEGERENEVM